MTLSFRPGDPAFLIESGRFIREGRVVHSLGGVCAFRFSDTGGGIRVSADRLFPTREAAEKSIPKRPQSRFSRHPWT